MTPKEFKLWFDGFWAAADGAGVGIEALNQLKQKVDSIEETTGYRSMPHYVQPCKENNWNAAPLNTPMTFDPSVVYSNGAVGVMSCGEAYSGIAADILQNSGKENV